MRNNIAILIMLAAMMTACGTFKKATNLPQTNTTTPTTPEGTTDPMATIIATLGDWQTMQTGGNIAIKGSSNFSSSVQVRMVRDEAIFISLRPMLGIEVGRMLITSDSIFVIDKVHKRFVAEKASLLTGGIPVTVSDLQDLFLGRPFVLGQGTLREGLKGMMTATASGGITTLTAKDSYKGHNYSFNFGKSCHITTLTVGRGESASPVLQVNYADVKATNAGNIAHNAHVNATIENKKLDLEISYKNIDWNKDVKIDRSIPSGYSRMGAGSLFNLFSN